MKWILASVALLGAIALGVGLALYTGKARPDLGARSFVMAPALTEETAPAIVPKDTPVVVRITGDLAVGGAKRNDGSLVPYVIGDVITLEAEALNATEYRWAVNGEALKDKAGQEWSVRKDREYEIAAAGELRFSVQVRGADPGLVSQPKELALKTVPLFIESFEKSVVEDDDRCLTGDDFTVEVMLAEPVTAGLDFYLFRYFVNDAPIKHPEDGKEWTTERDLTYTFAQPGHYSFKVEVRRAAAKEAEATAILAETITVADAVLLTFDAFPDKYAPLGTTVNLDVFPESIFGKSEVRFGVKKVQEAEFKWIQDEDGTIWGAAERAWLPSEPGNYLLRAEIRETGKNQADDSRELLYTITVGDF